jgi:hypothetical protein
MDYAALKAELAQPVYAGMSDDDIAAALNAATVEIHRDAPGALVKQILLRTTEWGRVVRVADGRLTKPDAVVDICISLVGALTPTMGAEGTLAAATDEDFARLQMMAGALAAAGVIAGETRDALLALRTVTTSRAAQLGLGEVRPGDVATARVY